MEGVHIERQVIKFPFVIRHRTVSISVEWHNAVHKVPNLLVGGVEDVCSVFMDIDAFDAFTVHIAAQIWAFVDYEAFLASLLGKIGESGSIKARTYY